LLFLVIGFDHIRDSSYELAAFYRALQDFTKVDVFFVKVTGGVVHILNIHKNANALIFVLKHSLGGFFRK
jgi:hypothetical protein